VTGRRIERSGLIVVAPRGRPVATLRVDGAAENNLCDLSVAFGPGLTTVVGVSVSGTSSLIFDVVYHEARRRLLEALALASPWSRVAPARVRRIDGLAPAVAIGQDTVIRNPNSTMATATGIHPFLRQRSWLSLPSSGLVQQVPNHGLDDGAVATRYLNDSLVGEHGDRAVSRSGGDAVRRGKLHDRRQLVARLQLPRGDLASQVCRDLLIRATGFGRRRRWSGENAGHRLGGPSVGVVHPGGIHLQGDRAPAAVAESAGNSAQVDAGGEQFGRRVMPERVQAGAAQLEAFGHVPVPLADRPRRPGGGRVRVGR
jgi:hypothetical protein